MFKNSVPGVAARPALLRDGKLMKTRNKGGGGGSTVVDAWCCRRWRGGGDAGGSSLENLQAMVPGVSHDDASVAVDGDTATREVELSVA
jgi:hypothetical protein